jgi:hypothetical protein
LARGENFVFSKTKPLFEAQKGVSGVMWHSIRE